MATCRSATSVVAIVLLGCSLWSGLDAGTGTQQRDNRDSQNSQSHRHSQESNQQGNNRQVTHGAKNNNQKTSQIFDDQVSQISGMSYIPGKSGAPKPPAQKCEVDPSARIPCGLPGITSAACEAIDCCFREQQCYFGKAVTVQCTKDAQFIVVVAKDATFPDIITERLTLLRNDQGCTYKDSNSAFVIYHFPVTACGTVVKEEPGFIVYENWMIALLEVGLSELGAVTRDSSFELRFQCRYVSSSAERVSVDVLEPLPPQSPVVARGPIHVEMTLANGQCSSKGCNDLDVVYNSFYTDADYPVVKTLRDPVFVQVRLLDKTDPNLVLILGHCWATTGLYPHSLPQWEILIDGCPYSNDRYMSRLVQIDHTSGLEFPNHYKRFIFQMFTFVDGKSMDPLSQTIYIHCSTAICTPAPGHICEQACLRKKRHLDAMVSKPKGARIVASVGPVILK